MAFDQEKQTSRFPCVSPPSLQGETGKSTLIFLDCFKVSDSFNTAKYFCLVSKKLPGINVEVLKDLRPFPKPWAFLAFVPTSLKFLQAKIYKLCPLPDIAQQEGCWKNKKDGVVWNARSEMILPTCTSPCYQTHHLPDLSVLCCNEHVGSHLLKPTGWQSEEDALGEAWFLHRQGTLNSRDSFHMPSMYLHSYTLSL